MARNLFVTLEEIYRKFERLNEEKVIEQWDVNNTFWWHCGPRGEIQIDKITIQVFTHYTIVFVQMTTAQLTLIIIEENQTCNLFWKGNKNHLKDLACVYFFIWVNIS